MPICNICNGTAFVAGPGDRLSRSGQPPQCAGCRAIERHRIGRAVAETFRDREMFRDYRLVSWGEQGTVARGWFKSAEQIGALEGDEMLAAQPAGSIDFLLCSNVLQSVAEPRRTISRIDAALSHRGLAMIAYPNPFSRSKTEDWGAADPRRGGAWRTLGRDFEATYGEAAPEAIVLCVKQLDPVTGDGDLVYVLTKNPAWMRRLFQVELDVRILD